jgi:hypothetical protein
MAGIMPVLDVQWRGIAAAVTYTDGMRKEPSVKVTVRLPESVLTALREVAEEERRSLTSTLVLAAEDYLRRKRAPPLRAERARKAG